RAPCFACRLRHDSGIHRPVASSIPRAGPSGRTLARRGSRSMARRLGQILVDMGYLDEEKLWALLEEQKRSGSELIGRVAVRLDLVKEEQVLKALGEQLGMKVIKLSETTIPSELTELVNETMATAFKVVPISKNKKDKSLTLAMAEPQNPATIDSLHSFLQVPIKGVIASEAEVMTAIE